MFSAQCKPRSVGAGTEGGRSPAAKTRGHAVCALANGAGAATEAAAHSSRCREALPLDDSEIEGAALQCPQGGCPLGSPQGIQSSSDWGECGVPSSWQRVPHEPDDRVSAL